MGVRVMKHARIENDIVIETFDGDLEGLFHPNFIKELIAVDEDVQQGMICDGGVFTAPEQIVIDPRETMVLTKLEAKLRLLELGLYTKINDAVLAMDDCFLKVKWLNADFFKRLDVDLVAYLHSLGMTDEQIDELFTAPNKL
jgi:hypothetical protein